LIRDGEGTEQCEQEDTQVPRSPKKQIMAALDTIRRGFRLAEHVSGDIFHALNGCEKFCTKTVQREIFYLTLCVILYFPFYTLPLKYFTAHVYYYLFI